MGVLCRRLEGKRSGVARFGIVFVHVCVILYTAGFVRLQDASILKEIAMLRGGVHRTCTAEQTTGFKRERQRKTKKKKKKKPRKNSARASRDLSTVAS